MIEFITTIKKFTRQGEKSGWTYLEIKAEIAEQLIPGNKKTFRVKGYLDSYALKGKALIPMGGGDFVMALNAGIRKAIGKTQGATLVVKIEVDKKSIQPPADLLECLADEPKALEYFETITNGHRNYFINWIESAKTDGTKAKRIACTVNALSKKWDYGKMIRSMKNNAADFKRLR